ncbi:DUF3857 domain-containing protein [Flavobacterium urocaniciphilum]|uniref:DUF3857 domain-containing protein n=1 Tax=Flavobacterium urocaniciphilum TaxID=1299341 RepID=A0A1H9BSU5_9FLAO|nr:DUF3857 domain-containing protein [Flavobacterium urocaniciphilum]SEP91887.1 protein of unknown function [Flavobacterium urocaniciphilum]
MKKALVIFTLLFVSTIGFSQEIKSYTWDIKPTFKNIPEEYKNQPAVVLFDKRWVHTRIGGYSFASFTMNHCAIKINKAEEINNYNKIKAEDNGFIRDTRDFHARIIKPNGEIKVLPQEKIVKKEIDKVQSIVFEGVEAGDIIEYYFILKENPSAYGVEVFQREIPVLYAEFSSTNSGVYFEKFASNEFKSSINDGKSISYAENIPPFVEEKNAKNLKNLVKLIYMISVTNAPDNLNWSNFLPLYFKKPSFAYFKKNQAREFIEKLNVTSGTIDEKVTKIDAYIKENFDFVWKGEKAKKISNLGDGKQKLTANDIFELYGFTFKELKIPYKVVVGMSRFDGDISNYKFVAPLTHEFMYYIPDTKKFVSPYEKYLAYGFPMYELQGSSGIFYDPSKAIGIEGMQFPIAPADFTVISTQNKVVLSEDLSTASIEKIYSTQGYEGQLIRNSVNYLKSNEEEKELLDFLKNRTLSDIDAKISKYTFENQEFKNNHTNTPFIVNLNVNLNESISENAGNLLLVNIGKVIGKQTNLYQETERKFDVDIAYAKTYKHKIIFTIPEGYEVESFKDLVFDKKMTGKEGQECSFVSTVKTEENQLIVEVNEVYGNITYTVDSYSEYRNIINAAADFAKGNVVLKQKK